jgi:hypothetical protein
MPRLIVMHAFSWLIASFIAAMAMADGGVFAGIEAAGLYFIPQAVWLLVDTIRYKRRQRDSIKPAQISN